jgi:hypothetical protein
MAGATTASDFAIVSLLAHSKIAVQEELRTCGSCYVEAVSRSIAKDNTTISAPLWAFRVTEEAKTASLRDFFDIGVGSDLI